MTSSEAVAPHIPYLRRYARALAGTRALADRHVRACLETLLADPCALPPDLRPRLAIYWLFHQIWETSANAGDRAPSELPEGGDRVIQLRLGRLPSLQRQCVLLTALEGFSIDQAARILERPALEVAAAVGTAMEAFGRDIRTDVMIIEDQSVIALDLATILEDLGHRVLHVATTGDEAVAAAGAQRPNLILADVQLADDSSGVDAVRSIVRSGPMPVVFVTAFPERLERESLASPTFVITKPFLPDTIKTAVCQALFFNPPELTAPH